MTIKKIKFFLYPGNFVIPQLQVVRLTRSKARDSSTFTLLTHSQVKFSIPVLMVNKEIQPT